MNKQQESAKPWLTCEGCKFYNEVRAECHALPPSVLARPNCGITTVRPKVKADDLACSMRDPK